MKDTYIVIIGFIAFIALLIFSGSYRHGQMIVEEAKLVQCYKTISESEISSAIERASEEINRLINTPLELSYNSFQREEDLIKAAKGLSRSLEILEMELCEH